MRIRRPKHNLEFIQKGFRAAGCKLLTNNYKSSKQVLTYLCSCGRKQQTNWNNFSRGYRCPGCYMDKIEAVKLETMKRKHREIKYRDQYFSLTDAAHILGVKYRDLYNEVSSGRLPKPTRQVNGRLKLYYNAADIKRISKLIV